MRPCYSVALCVEGWPCLVVGGGKVAERKVRPLLEAGACVRVVAPRVTEGLRSLAARGAIEIIQRAACPADLDWARLAIIATDDDALNSYLLAHARERRVLVNVVDAAQACDFHAPALVRRGPLTVAISTGGACPALARRLREWLETVVGPEYGELAALLGELRGELATVSMTQRSELWRKLLDSDLIELLRAGRAGAARAKARQIAGLAAQPPSQSA